MTQNTFKKIHFGGCVFARVCSNQPLKHIKSHELQEFEELKDGLTSFSTHLITVQLQKIRG